jgi:hypothetical protein
MKIIDFLEIFVNFNIIYQILIKLLQLIIYNNKKYNIY